MYKKLKNQVTRDVKSAKSEYYCDLIEEARGDSNTIWKAVNEAAGRGAKYSSPQCTVLYQVVFITLPLGLLLHV